MTPIRPLFISYYYPPAGGPGLPGSQRSVKFIRCMSHVSAVYVLSILPKDYPESILLNYTLPVPVNGETILRVPKSTDRFQQAMNLRLTIKNRLKPGGESPEPQKEGRGPVSSQGNPIHGAASIGQRIKDFIHYAYYQPDMMAPWINHAVKAGCKLVKQEKINVIFATGTPWSALVAAQKISRKTGVPFIADFRDPWIGNPFAVSKGRILDTLESNLERNIVASSALVTANTEPLRQEFIKRYPGIDDRRFITLPNGFDLHDFETIDGIPPIESRNTMKLVLAHAGTLYGKRDPAALLSAMQALAAESPELVGRIEFQQIGGISLDYDIRARYRDLNENKSLTLIDSLPYDQCLRHLKKADVLVSIQPGTKNQVPSKIYDYLCLNRHLLTITPLDGALGRMVAEHGLGECFSPENKSAITRYLKAMVGQKLQGTLSESGCPNRDKFDVRIIAETLISKMAEIVSR